MACDRQAPKIFTRTTKSGLPLYAVLLTLAFGALAYMNVSTSGEEVFTWLYTLSSITGILTWMAILATYLRFRAGVARQGIDRSLFPYRAPLQPYLSWFSLFFLMLVVIFNGFAVFLDEGPNGGWSINDFISAYISVPIFIVSYFGWKFWKGTSIVSLETMNFGGRRMGYGETTDEFIVEKKKGWRRPLDFIVRGMWE